MLNCSKLGSALMRSRMYATSKIKKLTEGEGGGGGGEGGNGENYQQPLQAFLWLVPWGIDSL